jgi:hypothetical protein
MNRLTGGLQKSRKIVTSGLARPDRYLNRERERGKCYLPERFWTREDTMKGNKMVAVKMVAVAAVSFVGAAWSIPVLSWAQETNATQAVGETTVLEPNPPSALSTQAVGLSAQQREALLARKRELQKGAAATTQANPPSPPGLPPVEGQGSDLGTKR